MSSFGLNKKDIKVLREVERVLDKKGMKRGYIKEKTYYEYKDLVNKLESVNQHQSELAKRSNNKDVEHHRLYNLHRYYKNKKNKTLEDIVKEKILENKLKEMEVRKWKNI